MLSPSIIPFTPLNPDVYENSALAEVIAERMIFQLTDDQERLGWLRESFQQQALEAWERRDGVRSE